MQDAPVVEVKNIDHLGVVSSIVERLGITDRIDNLIPKKRTANLNHGEVVKAMILSGLGFSDRRMYLMEHFLGDRPVDKLFGNHVTAKMFNDDVFERTLDKIYKYGPSEFFMDVAMKILADQNLLSEVVHLDSTSFSVKGKYRKNRKKRAGFKLTYGHSKDHRPDLLQMVTSMVCTGDGIPFWTKCHSGNEADRSLFLKVIDDIEFEKPEYTKQDFIYCADSALYTGKYLMNQRLNTKFITRVPESIKEARELLEKDSDKFKWENGGVGRKYCLKYRNLHKTNQKWVIVQENKARFKEKATFETNLELEGIKLLDKKKYFDKKIFDSVKDIREELLEIKKKHPYWKFNFKIGKVNAFRNKQMHLYNIHKVFEFTFYKNEETVKKMMNRKGRYIIATNVFRPDYPPKKLIEIYCKEHMQIEGCFKFMKDKTFNLRDVYLKRTDRIQALVAVMALTLFVNNLGQLIIRKGLEKLDESFPTQAGKKTKIPTLKWIFKKMRGINLVKTRVFGTVYEQTTNLLECHRVILRILGPPACEIYGFS
jgi:transposase